jgi:hypothetical protein
MSSAKRSRNRLVSVAQWAEHVGLADDGRSIATARQAVARGDGPPLTNDGNRGGVHLDDHAKWARSTPWGQYLG